MSSPSSGDPSTDHFHDPSVSTLIHSWYFRYCSSRLFCTLSVRLSDKYKLTQLADLLRNISVALLGILQTMFLGVISVQGASGSVADGVSLKAVNILQAFCPDCGEEHLRMPPIR